MAVALTIVSTLFVLVVITSLAILFSVKLDTLQRQLEKEQPCLNATEKELQLTLRLNTLQSSLSELQYTVSALKDEANKTKSTIQFVLDEVQLHTTHLQSLQSTVVNLMAAKNSVLNKLETALNATDQLNSLQSSVNTLNITTMDQLSDLQSSVGMLNATTIDQLNNLQSSLDIHSNSTTNLHRNCIQELKSCTMSSNREIGWYWRNCSTPSVNATANVS